MPSRQIIELKGSPTDNNATLFAQGYDGVLDPLYASGKYVKEGEQAVPNWDNAQAGTIFENLLTAAGGKIDGVIATNDGMGQSVITVLKKHGIKAPDHRSGRDRSWSPEHLAWRPVRHRIQEHLA